MISHQDAIRLRLAAGPRSGSELAKDLGVSQPTASRALSSIAREVIQIGQRRWSQYVLRDLSRGLNDIPVYRVDAQGQIKPLGLLIPVRPDGYVMSQTDGKQIHSDGMPWWLTDMKPQGFLGRAYAHRYSAELGLPPSLKEWSDAHAVRALLVHGHDLVGNLLLGDIARDKFLTAAPPQAIGMDAKALHYAQLAEDASSGASPGSSAGGEQPKFTAYAQTNAGPRHVIVKFTEKVDSPVSQRWRDILLAEHLALSTLRQASISAAQTEIIDHCGQRFLEVQRFDREGSLGRRALVSLNALDAQFVGQASQPWPVIAHKLAQSKVITHQALQETQMLWAFGTLIGNSDMHGGNISFVSEHGQPYQAAPAYDMTTMCFAPTSAGALPGIIPLPHIHSSIPHDTWRQALKLSQNYLAHLQASDTLNSGFEVCVNALKNHIEAASIQIQRLA